MESSTLNKSLNAQSLFQQLHALSDSKKFLIAYSGGLDSHCLLHLISQLFIKDLSHGIQVRAMHIHHGLQKDADAWVPHCQQVCDDLNIPLTIQYLNLETVKGRSTEEVARTARYESFENKLKPGEVLLTAHHQNDQAETFLLQLFRGAGVQGLASMPTVSEFGLGQHARPFLSVSRNSLEDYAKNNQLDFIEDLTNQDSSFYRNYLRNEVLPLLRSRWSSIDKTISRSASIQAETMQVLDEVAEHDLTSITSTSHTKNSMSLTTSISVSELLKFSIARQKLVLRRWIAKNGFQSPSEKKLIHIFSDVINAREDAQPLVEWKGAEVRRFRDDLYIMSQLQEHDNKQVIAWKTPNKPLHIQSLNIELASLESSKFDETKEVTVRFRQGGEKFFHSKKGMRMSLKNFFNESDVPPWQRSRIPLIYSGDALVKIVGIE